MNPALPTCSLKNQWAAGGSCLPKRCAGLQAEQTHPGHIDYQVLCFTGARGAFRGHARGAGRGNGIGKACVYT